MEEKDIEIIAKREQRTLNAIQDELSRIQSLGAGLNESDKDFIRARADFLSEAQKKAWAEFIEVLETKPTKTKK